MVLFCFFYKGHIKTLLSLRAFYGSLLYKDPYKELFAPTSFFFENETQTSIQPN